MLCSKVKQPCYGKEDGISDCCWVAVQCVEDGQMLDMRVLQYKALSFSLGELERANV